MTTDQIQQIISALKGAAGGGWQALVSNQLTTGWIGIILAALLLFITVCAFIIAAFAYRKADWSDTTPANVVFCLSGLLGSVTLLSSFVLVFCTINQVVNPDGAAIQQLVGGL